MPNLPTNTHIIIYLLKEMCLETKIPQGIYPQIFTSLVFVTLLVLDFY